jgi:hypothetical protein
VADFQSQFQMISNFVQTAATTMFSKLDQLTFKMMIDQLKSTDYEAVRITLAQLVKERKPLSVPPIYFVSQAHPLPRVRAKAKAALKDIGCEHEVEKITKNKSIEEAVRALIDHYGNYRQL